MKATGKNLLYIAYLFPPIGGGGVQRPLHSANLLSELNWNVTILTESIQKYRYDAYDWSLLDALNSEVVVYRPGYHGAIPKPSQSSWASVSPNISKPKTPDALIKSRSISYWAKTTLKRLMFEAVHILPDRHYDWIWRCWQERSIIRSRGPFDLVLASVRPASSMVLGWLLSISMKVPLVVEYRDLWMGQEFHEDRILPTKEWFDRGLEHRILLHSQRINVVTPAYQRILSNRYPDIDSKIRLYTNGYPDKIMDVAAEGITNNSTLTIRHVGRIYGKRNIGNLLEAVDQLLVAGLISENEISIEFIGPPLSSEQQVQLESCRCRSCVTQPGYVPLMDAFALQRDANLLLLVETTGDVYPGKVFEYLGLRRPILGVLARDGILWQLLEQAGDHFLAAHDDPETIRECLARAIELWRKGELHLQNINESLVASFARRRVVDAMNQDFLAIIESK